MSGYRLVYRVLAKEIAEAQTWSDIELATDALFHARLIWDGMERERKLFAQDGAQRQREPGPAWNKV